MCILENGLDGSYKQIIKSRQQQQRQEMMWAKSTIYCKQKNVKCREKIYREEWGELGIIWIGRNRNWKGNAKFALGNN